MSIQTNFSLISKKFFENSIIKIEKNLDETFIEKFQITCLIV